MYWYAYYDSLCITCISKYNIIDVYITSISESIIVWLYEYVVILISYMFEYACIVIVID
jgi:hypothetical protein